MCKDREDSRWEGVAVVPCCWKVKGGGEQWKGQMIRLFWK